MVIPKFVRCLTVICRCAGEVGKIGGSGTKLIPHGEGTHAECMAHALSIRVWWSRSVQPLWADMYRAMSK
jgi:hypothetical protein